MNIWEFFDNHFLWFMIYTGAVWLIPAFWVISKFPNSEDSEDD